MRVRGIALWLDTVTPWNRRGGSVRKPEQVGMKEKSTGYKLQAWQVWPGMRTTKTGSGSTLSDCNIQRHCMLDDDRFIFRPEVQGNCDFDAPIPHLTLRFGESQ